MSGRPARPLLVALVTLAAALLARRWVVVPIVIASGSMSPTLPVGQRLFQDRLTYLFRGPRRGEIIAFRNPVGEDHESIKRVIAVAGDTVELRRKRVWLNGAPLHESYTRYTRPDELLAGDDLGLLRVPEGALFVLGDNRDESNDSASWRDPATGGRIYFLKTSDVTGKVRGAY